MCAPLAAASIAVSAASSIAGAIGKNRAAAKNKAAALKAEMAEFSALNERQLENHIAATAQKDSADRQARTVIGAARQAAAESGVTGNSVAALLHSMDADRAQYDNRVDLNLTIKDRQIAREREGAEATEESRAAAVQPANPFAVGLDIGGDILGGLARGTALTTPNPNGVS